jgi:transcriptional regulator with XRE-family HTH domain
MASIGAEVRLLRTGKKCSLEKLSFMTGLNIDYISRLERGLVGASIETLDLIAKKLGAELTVTFEPKDK